MVVFAIFFALGVWLLQQQAALPGFAWVWLLLLPFTFFPFLLRSKKLLARSIHILLLAAFTCGAGFYHAAWQAEQRLAVSLPGEWQGRDIEVIGVVAELPRRYERGLRFVFDVEQILTPQAGVPQRIYLSTYSDDKTAPLEMKAGERWRLTLRLKQPHGSSNPHGFDFEVWALERNIRATGYVHNSEKLLAGHPKGDNRRIDALADGFGYRIETWREAVREKFGATLGDAPYSGVLSALAIGDQNSISAAQWQVFTRTGVNHLMSISGLHITMLASLAFAVAYWLWRRSARLILFLPARKFAALAALLTAIGYALLSGFAVPAQRTVYMVGAVAVALWLNRNFSPGQILSIALLGVLIPDPWAVMSAGFWLSFGAVALILFVSANRIGRSHWLAEYATVQWAMAVGLTPLLLGLFQQASLVSPIANAVTIPLVSLIVVPLTLLGAALPPWFGNWDAPLWLAHFVMSGVAYFLEWLNALPQAVWTQHAPPAWSVAAAMLGALWILLPRGFPARWLGLPLLLPLFLNAPEPPQPGALRLVVFDVGQGLAVAAQTRNHALLYDTGPDFSGEADSGNRILVPALRALGIGKLDGLVLSHDDSDHTGGAASIMQAMPVGWISSSLPAAHPLLQQVTDARRCADGASWNWDGVQFDILHPAPDYADANKTHDNDLSCVLRIGIGKHGILLAGDIEKNSEARLLRLHADKLPASLLVAPHHGSKSSSSLDFVAATLPDYVVFTAGYRNRFGHPREEVLQRYADSGAELLRSDEDGAILVEMNAQGLQVERYRKTQRRYWTHIPRS
ncbi:MAG: DNA internalization-related competence protein ComEC/Rec2 [Gallionellales bacterium RIFCSPLOWO2_12_FULL_59_22]|nr:MAG: DNA internalization-related competence protein ComEC/Rec2 [Gallionellales bacterium RIFCSPLOWO2_02_FULL_59_110]OGT14816.1 MAG: DNA internalization-related competence protein ComEC/Rec2 [Gallionellales bacterium RIFCSPLOWO2_12_FULL_59_22]